MHHYLITERTVTVYANNKGTQKQQTKTADYSHC